MTVPLGLVLLSLAFVILSARNLYRSHKLLNKVEAGLAEWGRLIDECEQKGV